MTAAPIVVADLCPGDEPCDTATACSVCEDGVLCAEHSDDFITCVANPDLLHHGDCLWDCPECEAAYAQDHARGEL